MVGDDAPIALRGVARRFVSRGGEKLRAALDRFAMDPAGLECARCGSIDRGVHRLPAPGGGRARDRGGRRVRAAGVVPSHGRAGDRDGTDERPGAAGRRPAVRAGPGGGRPVVHLHSASCCRPRPPSPRRTRCSSCLVKPQFEAGPEDVGSGGVVRDPAVWARVLRETVRRGRPRPNRLRSGSWPRPSSARRATWSSCSMAGRRPAGDAGHRCRDRRRRGGARMSRVGFVTHPGAAGGGRDRRGAPGRGCRPRARTPSSLPGDGSRPARRRGRRPGGLGRWGRHLPAGGIRGVGPGMPGAGREGGPAGLPHGGRTCRGHRADQRRPGRHGSDRTPDGAHRGAAGGRRLPPAVGPERGDGREARAAPPGAAWRSRWTATTSRPSRPTG